MDTKKIGLIGALVIVAIALVGGIVLTARGVPVPPFIAGPLTLLGVLLGWLAPSPAAKSDDAPPKPPTVPPLPLLALCLALPLAGCSLIGSKGARTVLDVLACVQREASAGRDPVAIAETCGIENAQAVLDLITASKGVASAAPKMAPLPAPSASGSAK